MTAMDGQTGETFACVWDALMDSPAEAAAMRVRSDLLSAICDTVADCDVTRAAAAQHLHLTGPRLDELLRGCVSRFSIDDLIGIATRANLDVRVQAKPASTRQNAADAEESRTHECSAEERALLGEAFSALRRERGKAWIDACRRADERGKRRPGLRTGDHFTVCSKSHAKRKMPGDQSLLQTKVLGWAVTPTPSLALSIAKSSFRTRPKGKLFVHGPYRAVSSKP